jgi:hypothetical protein
MNKYRPNIGGDGGECHIHLKPSPEASDRRIRPGCAYGDIPPIPEMPPKRRILVRTYANLPPLPIPAFPVKNIRPGYNRALIPKLAPSPPSWQSRHSVLLIPARPSPCPSSPAVWLI